MNVVVFNMFIILLSFKSVRIKMTLNDLKRLTAIGDELHSP